MTPLPVPLFPWRTPLGYTRSAGVAGQPWAPGTAWLAAGGSVWRGGGGRGKVSLPRSAPLPSPGGHQGGPPCLRIPGCRCSAAAYGAGAEPTVRSGQCGSEWAVDWGRLARGCARRGCGVPPLGAAALSGGCGAAVSLDGLRPPTSPGGGGRGGGVGGRGGSPQSPPGPVAPPPDGRGGAARWFRSGGASRRLGGRTLPPPPSTLWVPDPREGPRWGPLLSSLLPRGAGWPGGGGEGRRVRGAAVRVSGQRLAGCGAVGLPSRSLPPSSLPLEVARAPPPRRTVGGGGGLGGPAPLGGVSSGTVPSPPPSAHRLGRRGAAVTCVVACVGAGSAAVAGSAGSSAGG